MKDTVKEAEALYRRMIRAQSPAIRLKMACRMFATAKALIRAGILNREGLDLGSQDLRTRMFLRLYGRDFNTSQIKKILSHLKTNACS
jgi:hypothetical protein